MYQISDQRIPRCKVAKSVSRVGGKRERFPIAWGKREQRFVKRVRCETYSFLERWTCPDGGWRMGIQGKETMCVKAREWERSRSVWHWKVCLTCTRWQKGWERLGVNSGKVFSSLWKLLRFSDCGTMRSLLNLKNRMSLWMPSFWSDRKVLC